MSADIRGIHATAWARSSQCKTNGNCVEIKLDVMRLVRVRDSKAAGATLAFATGPWSAFLRELPAVPNG